MFSEETIEYLSCVTQRSNHGNERATSVDFFSILKAGTYLPNHKLKLMKEVNL